jgi:predicted esterase
MEDEPEDIWFLCHGYGQLARELLEGARALEHSKRVLVAPEALSRFYHEDHERIGASWMTREDREREMEDYVRYLDLVHEQLFDIAGSAAARVSVLGFSQGAATAARWAVRGRAEVDHLVLWGAALPPELDDAASLAPLKTMRVTLVAGSRDALFPESAREEQRARLGRHGVAFTEAGFEGGHRLDDETLRQLAGG